MKWINAVTLTLYWLYVHVTGWLFLISLPGEIPIIFSENDLFFKCLMNDNFYSLRLFEFQIHSLFLLLFVWDPLEHSMGSLTPSVFIEFCLFFGGLLAVKLNASLNLLLFSFLRRVLVWLGVQWLNIVAAYLRAAHLWAGERWSICLKQENDFNDWPCSIWVCKWPNFYVWFLVGDVLHGEKCNVYYINNRRSIRESECGNASRLSMKPTMSMSLFFWDGICMLFACTVIVWQLAIICYPISVFF